jgi:hypothetical protein
MAILKWFSTSERNSYTRLSLSCCLLQVSFHWFEDISDLGQWFKEFPKILLDLLIGLWFALILFAMLMCFYKIIVNRIGDLETY